MTLHLRLTLTGGLAVGMLAACTTDARACLFPTNDYCVTCEDRRVGIPITTKVADWCPGGDIGLIILKGRYGGCQVDYFGQDCKVSVGAPLKGAGGIGPYDLLSPDDQVVSFSPAGALPMDLLAYRPGKGAAAVIRVDASAAEAKLHSTKFNRPDNGEPPHGIGSFDLGKPEDRVVALGKDLLVAYRPGSGNSAVVQFDGTVFHTLLDGQGIGSFNLDNAADQVVAIGSDLLFAYRPGSGASAVVQFDGRKFHTLKSGEGIGSFDLSDGKDRVVSLGERLALAYRPKGRNWAVVSFDGSQFHTLAQGTEGIGAFDLRREEDTVLALGGKGKVVAYRPGDADSAVLSFSGNVWHTLYSGKGLGAFALNTPKDRVAAISEDLVLAYRPGRGAAALLRFDGKQFNTLFNRPDR